jgi:hypothetical protein
VFGDYPCRVPELSEPASIPVVEPLPSRSDFQPGMTADGPRARRRSAPLARIGVVLFGIGLLSVAVVMVLFATGSHDLPLWLNLGAMLAPIGFGLGLLGVFLEARAASSR